MHRLTTHWPWTLRGQRHPRTVLLEPIWPKFQCLSPFWVTALQAILRQVHQMTPNDTEHYKVKCTLCSTGTTESQISIRFVLQPDILRRVLNDPNVTLNTIRSKLPYITYTITPSPKFHRVSLYSQPFSSCRAFGDKCTERPQNEVEHH